MGLTFCPLPLRGISADICREIWAIWENQASEVRLQRSGSGSPRVHAAGASPSPYAPRPRVQKPPRSRGGSVTFTLRTAPRAFRSPRVHAAGASPSPYAPRPPRSEAPAFTRREHHLQPTHRARAFRSPRVHAAGASPSPYAPRPRVQKPPRSRGGSITFNLRTAPARSEAPAFTRREHHLHPTHRACAFRSPRVHAAGASPSTYVRASLRFPVVRGTSSAAAPCDP